MNDRHQPAAGIVVGAVLAGKYRVERVLGAGGMGVVVAAHHLQLDVKVALKFLLPAMLLNPSAVSRFEREARAAVRIKSEHVARVTDVGTLEDGVPYMVMEYLEGVDLSAWIAERGPLPIEQAVEFVLQASEAIAEAHALGIVHRDLKPSNLFVLRRPDGALSVKVLDFGISKTTGVAGFGGAASATNTSSLMGSPLYMSPEQMRSSKDVDARSDIWALGVILFESLTKSPPFMADTMPELVLKVVSEPPPPLRSRRADAPEGLEKIIRKCLSGDRAKRYESVATLAAALLPYAPERSRVSLERISGVMAAAGLSETAPALPEPSSERRDDAPTGAGGTAVSWGARTTRKGRGAWIAMAGVGAVVAGGGILFALGQPVVAEPTAGSAASSLASFPSASAATIVSGAAQVPSAAGGAPAAARIDAPGEPPPSVAAPAHSSEPVITLAAHDAPVSERKAKKTAPRKPGTTPVASAHPMVPAAAATAVQAAPAKAPSIFDDR